MLSIVIPVYNEVESLAQLHSEIDAVDAQQHLDVEIIFVDDGSVDGSWRVIQQLAVADPRVRGIRFRRNFGKAAALSAGFAAAHGDLVFTLDADLQDDPQEIPRFLDKIQEGYDVVSGWKQVRHDPWHKVLPSRVFNWLVSKMTKVSLHDHNCGFKCYRREIFDEVRLYGELHRFVPVLAASRGWRVGEIVVKHRRRTYGKSKYGILRIPKGFLDLLTVRFLTGFSQRPQHVLGTFGLLCFFLGSIGLLLLTGQWFLTRTGGWFDAPWLTNVFGEPMHLHQRAAFYYSLGGILLGSQLMSMGFLAELMTAYQGEQLVSYSIADEVGHPPATGDAAEAPPEKPATLPLGERKAQS